MCPPHFLYVSPFYSSFFLPDQTSRQEEQYRSCPKGDRPPHRLTFLPHFSPFLYLSFLPAHQHAAYKKILIRILGGRNCFVKAKEHSLQVANFFPRPSMQEEYSGLNLERENFIKICGEREEGEARNFDFLLSFFFCTKTRPESLSLSLSRPRESESPISNLNLCDPLFHAQKEIKPLKVPKAISLSCCRKK